MKTTITILLILYVNIYFCQSRIYEELGKYGDIYTCNYEGDNPLFKIIYPNKSMDKSLSVFSKYSLDSAKSFKLNESSAKDLIHLAKDTIKSIFNEEYRLNHLLNYYYWQLVPVEINGFKKVLCYMTLNLKKKGKVIQMNREIPDYIEGIDVGFTGIYLYIEYDLSSKKLSKFTYSTSQGIEMTEENFEKWNKQFKLSLIDLELQFEFKDTTINYDSTETVKIERYFNNELLDSGDLHYDSYMESFMLYCSDYKYVITKVGYVTKIINISTKDVYIQNIDAPEEGYEVDITVIMEKSEDNTTAKSKEGWVYFDRNKKAFVFGAAPN